MWAIVVCGFLKVAHNLRRRIAVRFLGCAMVLLLLCFTIACGSSKNSTTASGGLTGNWQITLNRHSTTLPLTFSGFLLQSGNSVAGSVVLGDGCLGVGPVTGTLDNQKLSLTINEFGQDVSLEGPVPASSGFLSGNFSTLPGGCTAFPNTGTWSAQLVQPLAGNFHGTFASTTNGTTNVTGNLTQGPNTGASNATLTGAITANDPRPFCSYLTTATISGVISGTTVTLNLFGPDGVQITQLDATATPDAVAVTGNYGFQSISNSCFGDQGTFQLMFP